MPEFGQHGERGAWAEMLRAELSALLVAARQLSAEELPGFLGELEVVRTTAMARLVSPGPTEQRDELLGVGRAAPRLGMSKDYLYRHHNEFPFTRRVGRRLLFSASGIDSYIKQQTVLTARRQGGTLHPARQREGGTTGWRSHARKPTAS